MFRSFRFPKPHTKRRNKKTFPFNGMVILPMDTIEHKETKIYFYSPILTLEKTTHTPEDFMVLYI